MTALATFDSRIAIQILAINDDVQRLHFDLNGSAYPYFVAGVMWIFNAIVWLGHVAIISNEAATSVSVLWRVAGVVVVALWWGMVWSNVRCRKKGIK